uniref:ras-like protein family member 11A n=1 Tax=Panthera onca TaxID=9690 RepID=UPI0029558614|nr:ras-like protein family member 11A [Panthera onca]
MRPPSMSGHCLLAPIPESSSDCLPPKDIKLAVLGAGRVGKSAMIVRFLTKRFIGDYEPNTGKLYSRLVYVEGDQLSLQIQDTPGGIQVRTARSKQLKAEQAGRLSNSIVLEGDERLEGGTDCLLSGVLVHLPRFCVASRPRKTTWLGGDIREVEEPTREATAPAERCILEQ